MKQLWNTLSKCYIAASMIFLYAPILVMMVLSFNRSRSRVVWGGFTLEWYTKLLNNRQIMEALGTTMSLAFFSALIALVIGVTAAMGIHTMRARNFRIVMGITNIPMVNADIVTGIALMLWFVRFMPLGFGSVLLAHITFNIPYVILSVLPKIQTMNLSIYEASRDLGAGPVYGFFTTILPQLAGGIISGFFLAFTMSMDDFVVTYFTRGAGINTLSTMIYSEIRKGIKPEMYALSTVLFAVIFLFLILVNFLPGEREEFELL